MSAGVGGRPTGAGGAGGRGGGGGPQPSSSLLVGTLGFLAVVAGLAIVFVHGWANPRIEEHRARELEAAIQEVLGAPERHESRWVRDGVLLDSLPAGSDPGSVTPVYAGYDRAGELVGYAVAGQKPGYQDVIRLLFGYDPRTGLVVGMKVLESRETPGLGSKIITDSAFVGAFHGVETPMVGVKDPTGEPGEVDLITGATISSEAVIDIINERLRAVGPALIAAHEDTTPGARELGGGGAP